MEGKIVKVGVVGAGRGAYIASELLDEKNVKIKAMCGLDREQIECNLKTWHYNEKSPDIEIFDNYDEMLKTDIDAVIIATYATDHVNFVEKAMNAGKHVLSEIPAVTNLEEAKKLKAVVSAHPDLKYMIAENCCYWAFIQSWKGMYDNGLLGEAIYAESEYIHSVDIREKTQDDYPKDHWRSYNPAIKYLTHNLGPLLYILNDRCVSVSCMTPDVKYNPYREINKNAVAIFKTAKGAVIRIFICFDAFVGFDHNFEIVGTRGTVETDKTKHVNEAHYFARLMDIPGSREAKIEVPISTKFPNQEDGGHGGADKKMMKEFIKCIVEDTEPPIGVDLAIRMSIPGIIAHESSLQGGAVLSIPDVDEL